MATTDNSSYIAPNNFRNKKALLIGINYIGHPQFNLNGCINDTRNAFKLLTEHFHYKAENIRILTDDQTDSTKRPIAASIRASIQWLVDGVQPGDSLFFQFSGHGHQVKDDNGDEDDGLDEVILPWDYNSGGGNIRDDYLFNNLVKPIPVGAYLTVLMDCCHSGTGLDLPFVLNVVFKSAKDKDKSKSKGKDKEKSKDKDKEKSKDKDKSKSKGKDKEKSKDKKKSKDKGVEISLVINTSSGASIGVGSGSGSESESESESDTGSDSGSGSDYGSDFDSKLKKKISKKSRQRGVVHTGEAIIVSLSGCLDSQTSADARISGTAQGAMTNAFIRSLENANYNISYQQLLVSLRRILNQEGKFEQIPQLSFYKQPFPHTQLFSI
eukprot:TRINITY_DN66_c0_g1_i8.p1 TRINITY_DN66_c0_g1~~TRINITY_DN66_c0_g1_i8.p1  ORF type:complete len:382 (-),score=185.93 TRINITY_DN66_c0_g1_i8:104-1249(-)